MESRPAVIDRQIPPEEQDADQRPPESEPKQAESGYVFDEHIIKNLVAEQSTYDPNKDITTTTIFDRNQGVYGVLKGLQGGGKHARGLRSYGREVLDKLGNYFDPDQPEESMVRAFSRNEPSIFHDRKPEDKAATIVRFYKDDDNRLQGVFGSRGHGMLIRKRIEGGRPHLQQLNPDSPLAGQPEVGRLDIQPGDKYIIITRPSSDNAAIPSDDIEKIFDADNAKEAARLAAQTVDKDADTSAVIINVPDSETQTSHSAHSQRIGGNVVGITPGGTEIIMKPWRFGRNKKQANEATVAENRPSRVRRAYVAVGTASTALAAHGATRLATREKSTDDRKRKFALIAGGIALAGIGLGYLAWKYGGHVLYDFSNGNSNGKGLGANGVLPSDIQTTIAPPKPKAPVKAPDLSNVLPERTLDTAPVDVWRPESFKVEPGSSIIREIHEQGHHIVGHEFTGNMAYDVFTAAEDKFGPKLISMPGHAGPDVYMYQGNPRISAPGMAHWRNEQIENLIHELIVKEAQKASNKAA